MNEILSQLNQGVRRVSFHLVGKAFYGKKDVSKKDGTYTATLWLSFFYLPVIPYDTYRLLTPEKGWLPRVFGFDDFIYYDTVRLKFDWQQVFYTLAGHWGGFAIFLYAATFLSLELGALVGWSLFGAAILAVGVAAAKQHWSSPAAADKPAPAIPQAVPARQPAQAKPAPVSDSAPAPEPAAPVFQLQPAVRAAAAPAASPAGGPPKFDPNKILMSNLTWTQLNKEDLKKDGFGPVEWLGLLNIVLLLAQVLVEFYFLLTPEPAGMFVPVHRWFQFFYNYGFFNFTGITLFVLLAFRKNGVVSVPLLLLVLVTLLRLQNRLFAFLLA